MSYINIWIHLVWGTKNKHPYLIKDIRPQVFQHIRENAKAKGIWLDQINGYTEHVHCLISLSAEHSISRVANLLKGESSFWINKSKLTQMKFEWADEYYAASISHTHAPVVRRYIQNQEEHHRKKSYQEEYEEFMTDYGFIRPSGPPSLD